MGMDLYGKSPKNKKGEYFRNNVWWWRPLWDFTITYAGNLLTKEEKDNGHMNNGQEYSTETAKKLAIKLQKLVKTGIAATEQKNYEIRHKKEEQENKEHPGKVRMISHYPFSEQNVKDFIKFLNNSGGFTIC